MVHQTKSLPTIWKISDARGSAMECNAILDVCRIQGCFSEETIIQGKQLLVRIVEMLTKLCR